ncbi:MAG: hypothetical protein M1829_005368 [Trizodia sp. TS-e1964]|nr:MAG: hypothetical protein M1829_005368 [Trizodia sp. TS-e1964]
MDPCKFFLLGHCMRGGSCRYSHEITPPAVYAGKSSNTSKLLLLKSGPSRNQLTSANESLSLAQPLSPKQVSENSLAPKQDSRSHVPCHYFAQGNCRNGNACLFSHIREQEQMIEVASDLEETQNHDNFRREIYGALVQFGPGAIVSKISLPSDFSMARINGLPADSTPESVATLVSEAGREIAPEFVRIQRQMGAGQISANIKVEDPGFAKFLCTKFNQKQASGVAQSGFEVLQVPAGLLSGPNARRVECKKVQCSWYKPTKTAWLNFGSELIVKRVFKMFTSKAYKILGQPVQCNAPTRSGAVRKNSQAWTLMLTDLPGKCTEEDIRRAIGSPDNRPRNIELGEPSYYADGETASATVMSLLNQAGPIEWSQVNTELQGKRSKAIARFYDEADAREAVRLLHNISLPFCKNLKLAAQLVSTAKFKVAESLFSVIQGSIRTASQTWKAQHLTFKVYPPTGLEQQYRVLKIEGQIVEDVVAAKASMDKILDGITVKSQGNLLWTPSLNHNGSAYQKLKQIQKDHGVIIIRDKRKAVLKLYGPPQKCPDAQLAIADMISGKSSTAYVINLNTEDFKWACSGGFKLIATTLGENIVTFDIVSTPKRILIDGSEKEYESALRVLKRRELKVFTETTIGKEDCTVCWTLPENPLLTRCNHVYCSECFENLCAAAGSQDQDASISCKGNMDSCKVIFDLEELQESLPSKAFEEILEASFTSHIKHCPTKFRFCPKPDCSMIYRVTSKMDFHTCANCLTVICTSCHNPHDGKTCAEFKDEASGGYALFEKAKKELGIKDCPRCKTSMEKIDGCNHMTCRGCQAHLCWVCLETFSTSQLCYAHLNMKHGGTI